MQDRSEIILEKLSRDTSLGTPAKMARLSPHASAREIYRLHYNDHASLIGVFHHDIAENKAFVGFSKAFLKIGLPVAKIYAWNEKDAYIETDFGDLTLYDHLNTHRTQQNISSETLSLYEKTITHLVEFQVKGLSVIDTGLCYDGAKFDVSAMIKDYSNFTKHYADRVQLGDQARNAYDDFSEIVKQCSSYEPGFFMYRDFQGRNIMITEQGLHFIDYQSGREGPAAYDLASLLFQASADLPFEMRDFLLDTYIQRLKHYRDIDGDAFKENFMSIVLMRAVQTLGVYGKLGLGEGKSYFRNSIPYAKKNMAYITANARVLDKHPYLKEFLKRITLDD